MGWLKRAAILIGKAVALLFVLILAFGTISWSGLVIVLSAQSAPTYAIGYGPYRVPLHKLWLISYGFPDTTGVLIGRCPDGRETWLYYVTQNWDRVVQPVGRIC